MLLAHDILFRNKKLMLDETSVTPKYLHSETLYTLPLHTDQARFSFFEVFRQNFSSSIKFLILKSGGPSNQSVKSLHEQSF